MKRSKNNMIFGVCAGIAESLKIDPIWIRVLFITLPSTILIYAVFYFLMDNPE